MTIRIIDNIIGPNKPVFIIAEAGVNHNGSLESALQLIDAAVEAGTDVVKFQTFRAADVVTKDGKMANYQRKNIGKDMSQKKMLEQLELPQRYYSKLLSYAKRRGILFMSTPHGGFRSVDFLESLNVPAYKIGSGDLTNLPLLDYIAQKNKPIILSTGMGIPSEIHEALETIQRWHKKIIILHCVSNYPCSENQVNLAAMEKMIDDFQTPIGFSDHTTGVRVAVAAVLLGACVIEKHITLDRDLAGPDQQNSLEPDEFEQMVQEIRKIEKISPMEKNERIKQIPKAMLGSKEKKPNQLEKVIAVQVRKSLVWSRPLSEGRIIEAVDISIKRPAHGLHPREYWNIIGRRLVRNVPTDAFIHKHDFQ